MKGLLLRTVMLSGIALLSIGAAPNWTATVTKTDGGHRLGNPDAKIKLITFESYTCPHCAHFEQEASSALKLAYVQPGKLSLEVRHVIRDPVDLTAAMLTNCGAPAKFFANHTAFFSRQNQWIATMSNASKTQRDRWYTGDPAARRRAVAADFGFYKIMEGRGYSRPQADACLKDEALAKRLAESSAADDKKYGITGTPSFALNGVLLAATYDWQLLRLQIDARL